MMINLVFIIFFYIKHLILRRLNKITTTGYVTASCIWIGSYSTSWIKFSWRIKTKVLACWTIVFKLVYIFYMYPTSVNTCWSFFNTFWPFSRLLLITLFVWHLRISSQNRSWFLVFIRRLNLEILLLCLLFWSYLIHRFCAYSYSWLWLYFHWDLLCIISDDDTSFSIFVLAHFWMLFNRSIWRK